MKRIVVEIPDTLHRAMKNRCFSTDRTMKNYLIDLLQQDLKGQVDAKK